MMREDGIPRVAAAIVQGRETVFAQEFGLPDVENGSPVTPETLFHISQRDRLCVQTQHRICHFEAQAIIESNENENENENQNRRMEHEKNVEAQSSRLDTDFLYQLRSSDEKHCARTIGLLSSHFPAERPCPVRIH